MGYSNGSYKPKNNITRAELVTMVMKAFNKPPSNNKVNFTDADKIPSWASGYISVSSELGILKGYSDKTFRPLDRVKRCETFKVIAGCMDAD